MTRRAYWFFAIVALVAVHPPDKSRGSEAREKFATAYALYSEGNFSEARTLFLEAVDEPFPLADYSLYYLAMIADKESVRDQAREYLSRLRARYPSSVWRYPADLQLAKIDMAEGNLLQADESLRRLRADASVPREILEEALYLRAKIQEALGDPRSAHTLYLELREFSPQSSWAGMARNEQSLLRDKFPELFGFDTLQSLAEEAERLLRERQSRQAEVLYRKLLNNAPDGHSRLRYSSRLASLYLAIRDRNAAIPVLEEIARDFPRSTEAPWALYHIGQIYWNRHDNARALDYFQAVLDRYPSSAYVDRAQFAAADIHEFFGRTDRAVRLYTAVRKALAASSVRDDAGWRLAWLYYRKGEWAKAETVFRELGAQSKAGPYAVPSLYWRARIAERTGQFATAERLYRRIVNTGNESYYYALSARGLNRMGAAFEEPKRVILTSAYEPDPPLDETVNFHLLRARELSALTLHTLAVAELDTLQRRAQAGTRLRALLMREYFSNGAYGQSLRLAAALPADHPERDRHRYPLAFWNLIQEKAQVRGLDPHLVLALIRQESLFDTRARSPAAAYGLMQLIPPTAARVAKQLGVSVPSPEKLFDPEINITLGTEYLKSLLERYSNNWFKAIAAYNAGEAAVDRWQREIDTDDIEEFVERIPYAETRTYVKLVLRNHGIYKGLYELQK